MPPEQFGDEGDGGAGIERDLEDVGLAVGEADGAEAGARGQRLDALVAEIGPEDAGAGQAEERRDQQALDLRVAVVAQREQRPVGIGAAAREASTSMRRMMPSSPGAVESCTLPSSPGHDIDDAGEVDRVDVLGDRDDLEAERRPRPKSARQRHIARTIR